MPTIVSPTYIELTMFKTKSILMGRIGPDNQICFTKVKSTDLVTVTNTMKKQIPALKVWQHWGDNTTKDQMGLMLDNFEQHLMTNSGPHSIPTAPTALTGGMTAVAPIPAAWLISQPL